jgi:hypothetical protein
MAVLNFTILDSTLNDNTSSQLITVVDITHWITIQEVITLSVKTGSIQCELVYQGKGSLSFILINPAPVPLCGQTVKFIDRSKLYFGGFIQTVTLNSDQSESHKEYTIECMSWEGQLERTLIKRSDTNQTTSALIAAIINTGGILAVNGFTMGRIEESAALSLVDADYVRASEYLRDIASAGGGSIEISPEKVINFRKVDLREAPFELTNAEPEYVQLSEDLDDYCNSMTVGVTGTGGATANITRSDPAEIAKRQVIEGGSGIYEAFERVEHPTSNDVVQLARLGVSTAFLFMQSRARLNSKLTARLRRNLLDVGQLITCDMPGMNLDAQYQITRMSMSDEENQMLFEIEGTYTNRRQLNLDSLLRIARAAKTTIVIPTDNFNNVVTFTTLGSQSWVVPGSGTVQVEMEANGAGGGGGGGGDLNFVQPGGHGGNGGRAVSFREYTAGTSLTVFVGTGGTGGANGSVDGAAGTSSYVDSPTELRVSEGYGGGGGKAGTHQSTIGADGGADGDYIFAGGGMPGGREGIPNANAGLNGTNGKVIIRY